MGALLFTIIAIIIALVGPSLTKKVLKNICFLNQGLYESDAEFLKRKTQQEEKNKPVISAAKIFCWVILPIITLALLAINTIRIVPTGEVGVKTSFGVVSGYANEGFNFIAPWEQIVPLNTKIQKQSFTGLSASTKDAQSISNIAIDVNYSLNPDKAQEVYATVGENYQETLISPLLTQFIKDRLALYDAESLVTERNKIVDDITVQLQENLADYGINIVAVSLANYDFSPDFSSALERKAVAAKEIETAKNNQEKAKVEAETNRIKTEQLTDAVLMEKLIDAIKNGNGTYIIGDVNGFALSVK